MPEDTLNALADHGEINHILPAHGGDCEEVLTRFAKAGIDVDALAAQLQDEGARSFVKSWKELMGCIASRSEELRTSHAAPSTHGPEHSKYDVIASMIHRKYDAWMEMDG